MLSTASTVDMTVAIVDEGLTSLVGLDVTFALCLESQLAEIALPKLTPTRLGYRVFLKVLHKPPLTSSTFFSFLPPNPLRRHFNWIGNFLCHQYYNCPHSNLGHISQWFVSSGLYEWIYDYTAV